METDLEKPVKIGCVAGVLKEQLNSKLIGEVLTIVDASVSDPQSRKAVKSLISQAFTRSSEKIVRELNNIKEVQN